jgi:DNA-binding transcriptional ArsR family regulator
MSKVSAQSDDTFDVDNLRLSSCVAAPVSPSKPVRFGRGQRFLRGPIPWDWLSVAARLPGKALQVGLAVWHLSGLKNAMTVELSRVPLESLGVTRQAAYRGLKALENAGLIKAGRRSGRKTRVTILKIST